MFDEFRNVDCYNSIYYIVYIRNIFKIFKWILYHEFASLLCYRASLSVHVKLF